MITVPELLAPAGNLERLRTCLLYGADAVYLGGRSGNLRAACGGFTHEELQQGLREAKTRGTRIYYCLNSLTPERSLAGLPALIEQTAAAGVDGLIVADPGVLRLVLRYAPGVPVHLSTQANTSNSEAVLFWQEQGVSRVNLARELDCRELYAVRASCPEMELEMFIHGAMCLAVSGQCLLSAWLNSRPANQGRCTQPCRFEYRAMAAAKKAGAEQEVLLTVEERTRPGTLLWQVTQEEDYSSFWAPQDLCLLPWLPWVARIGMQAIKIEGRMKSSAYLAHVVDAYRTALDHIRENGLRALRAEAEGGNDGRLVERCMTELLYAASRPLGSGFFLPGKRRHFSQERLLRAGTSSGRNRSGESAIPDLGHAPLAKVLEPAGAGAWHIEARGNWKREADVELMLPGLARPVLAGGDYGLENQRGESVSMLGCGSRGIVHADLEGVRPGIFIRAAQ